MDKVIFLDRDGVINKCAGPHEYITSWDEFVFLSGVPWAIRQLNKAGYRVVIISNQRCIARGMATAKQVDALHVRLNYELGCCDAHIDAFYYCPHDIGQCNCRKPEIGLFLQAEQRFCVDKSTSWMIGDSRDDMIAGQAYGVRTASIGRMELGDLHCDSLLEAVKIILRKDSIL